MLDGIQLSQAITGDGATASACPDSISGPQNRKSHRAAEQSLRRRAQSIDQLIGIQVGSSALQAFD